MSTIRMTGMISGMDTESIITNLVEAQKTKNKKVSDKSTLLEWKQDAWKELNTKLYKLYTDDLFKMRLQASYGSKKVTTSDDSLISVTAGTNATTGTHSVEIKSLAAAQYVTSGKLGSDVNTGTKLSTLGDDLVGKTIKIGDKELTVTEDSTIEEFLNTAKSAGVNASFDSTNGRLFLSSKSAGVDNGFEVTGDAEVLNALKLDSIAKDSDTGEFVKSGTNGSYVAASNSTIVYNGAEISSNSNVVSVNGLTMTLKSEAVGSTINLNVINDTQATYDMVKSFVTSYNSILSEMNELYYADSASSYAPLSDDEKAEMSESQIEKWETKIKDSILRRDSTLESVLSSMKNTMAGTVTVSNGKSYSLSSFGIMTSTDYTEKGLLHIYGDSDDSTYSGEADKLLKALEEDPTSVIETLSGISKSLYDTMGEKMKSVSNVSSAYTFYNDKLMTTQQTAYKKQIATLATKLTDLENKYYKQFAAMETALANMQSQSSSLSSMLGTS